METLEDRVVPATAVYLGDYISGIAVDSLGNQYVNFSKLHGTVDLDPDATRTALVTGYDTTEFGNSGPGQPLSQFLVKYSPTQEVLWVRSTAAGDVQGFLRNIKIGSDAGVEYLYSFGGPLSKMDLNGNVVWSRATTGGISVYGCAFDADGSIYVNGSFSGSADLDAGTVWADGRDLVTGNGQSEFIAKWAPDGTLQWSRVITSTSTVWSGATTSNFGTIAVANGVVYTGGMFWGSLSLGGLTDQRIDSASGSPDGFIAAFDTNGNFQSIAHFIDAKVSSVRAVGSDVYLTAQFGYTADLDPGPGQKLLTPINVNGEGLAVARLTYTSAPVPTWTSIWADKFVSSGSNLGGGLEVSGAELYVSGAFGSTTDFDPTSGTYNLTAGGGQDIFAMKLSAATGALTWVSQMGSTKAVPVAPIQETAGLVVTSTGVYLGGWVGHGAVNFNGVKILDAGPDTDAFLAKLGTDGSRQWSFAVGAVGRTIDDGDPGYTESGSGWRSQTAGYNGDSRTHNKGNGSSTATWTFTGLPNGNYQVVTRFPAANKNASNAPFRVNGTLVTVDQKTAPNDFATEYDGAWESLGIFAVTNGTLTVVLSDAANGTVVADAVRIWAVASPRIGAFTASPDPVQAGSPLTLTAAGVQSLNPASNVTQVAFYVDSNGNGFLDPDDDLLGHGTLSAGAWTLNFTVDLLAGSYRLFAQARDSNGIFGDPLALDLDVL